MVNAFFLEDIFKVEESKVIKRSKVSQAYLLYISETLSFRIKYHEGNLMKEVLTVGNQS